MHPIRSLCCACSFTLLAALAAIAQTNWTDPSPHTVGYITVNQVRLHYLDWGGKGNALVLLHGLGDTSHIYDDVAPTFTNDFRVLGLTRRGHGKSDIPETGYDTATLVEDIRQFLDSMKIERVVLAGHSFAGDELTRFAVMHPDRVIKLVYFDSAYDRTRMPQNLRLRTMPPGLSPSKTETESINGMREYVQRINNSWSPAWEATLREQFSSDGKVLLNAEKKNRAAMSMMQASHNAPAEYSRIKAPALAFFSAGYKRFFDLAAILPDAERQNAEAFLNAAKKYQQQEIEYFRKEIPNGRVVVFTNADHHCFIDKEAEVLAEMRAFLSTSKPAK